MRRCIKCGEPFGRVRIGGHSVRTSKPRKHCPKCRPVGMTIHKENTGGCQCSVCGRSYVYDRSKGHTRTKCGTCSVNQRRFEIKEKAVKYKGGRCQFCGYNKCLRALGFHHIDPAKKEFGIGGNHCRAWDKVVKELDKCVLICSNCHDELHEGLITLGQHEVVQGAL